MQHVRTRKLTTKKAQINIETLENMLRDTMVKFTGAAKKLNAMKLSVDANQSFAEILHTKGNASDKVSRIPGMRDRMLHRKLYSGKEIELETLVWEFDKYQTAGKQKHWEGMRGHCSRVCNTYVLFLCHVNQHGM